MKDHTHILTRDNLFFTVRGNKHNGNFIRAAGLYKPSKNGKRVFNGIAYEKEVDEFGDGWVRNFKPEYCIKDDYGEYILIPRKDIFMSFDPFSKTTEIISQLSGSVYHNLINELLRYIHISDIGFIGSYLVGFPQEDSDIDIIVRGKNNILKLKENIDKIRSSLGAGQNLTNNKFEVSVRKYIKIFNNEFNDFGRMINNRWVTIQNKDFMTKIRFHIEEEELSTPELINSKNEITIEGEVLDDIGTNVMPRFFKFKSGETKYEVITFFWDFSYCVKNGEKVKICGTLFDNNRILIHDRNKHGIRFENE